jgi:hypothetical protein
MVGFGDGGWTGSGIFGAVSRGLGFTAVSCEGGFDGSGVFNVKSLLAQTGQ